MSRGMFARPNQRKGATTKNTPQTTPQPPAPQPVRSGLGLSERARAETYTPAQGRSLGYTLIQLRPDPDLLSETEGRDKKRAPPQTAEPPHNSEPRRCLGRWLFVYLPVAALIAGLLYVLCELAMKHLAIRSLHSQLLALPERPTLPLPPEVHTSMGRPAVVVVPPQLSATSDLHSAPSVTLRPMVLDAGAPQRPIGSFPYNDNDSHLSGLF